METSLAIYEALIQATVPPSAARRVAECLERDMTSNLATKNDLLLVRQDLEHFEQRMVLRFEAMEARFEDMQGRFMLMNQSLESRIVFKLGALMVVLVGLLGTLMKVLS